MIKNLEDKEVKYEEILLDDDTKRNTFFAKINRDTDDDDDMITSVPQIFIDETYVGGYTELMKSGKLDSQ